MKPSFLEFVSPSTGIYKRWTTHQVLLKALHMDIGRCVSARTPGGPGAGQRYGPGRDARSAAIFAPRAVT